MAVMKMINLKTVILWIAISVLVGCSGSRSKMESWLGVPQNQIIDQLGDPDRSLNDQSGRILIWIRYVDGMPTCQDRFTLKQDKVVTYFSDCGIWGGFNGPVYVKTE
jgi:hypothetical protein